MNQSFSCLPTLFHRRGIALFVFLCLCNVVSTRTEAVPAKIKVQLEFPITGEMSYWFADSSGSTSAPQALHKPNETGWVLVDVPAAYRTPGSQLRVLHKQWGKIAHLPLDGRDRVAVAFQDPKALLEMAWGDLVGSMGAQFNQPTDVVTRLWRNWLSQNGGMIDSLIKNNSNEDRLLRANILANGDFTQGLQPWFFGFEVPALATTTPISTLPANVKGKGYHFEVTRTATEPYKVQLVQWGLPIEEGQPYFVSFWARSSQNRSITLSMDVNEGDYHTIGMHRDIKLQSDWKEYSSPFMAYHVPPGHGRIAFWIGGGVGDLDLANVSVRPGIPTHILKQVGIETGLRLADTDFSYMRNLHVPVTYNGHGVTNKLEMEMKCNKDTYKPKLALNDKGIARFEEIPINEDLLITLRKGDKSQEFHRRLTPQSEDTVEELQLTEDWSGLTLTPNKFVVAKTAVPLPPVEKEGSNHVIYMLIGFLVVMGGVVGGLFWRLEAKRKSQQTQGTESMGALMAPHKIAIPSVHQGRESMLPVVSGQGRPVAKAPHPRLIGSEGIYRGYTFPLAPEITEIGRDIGNTLSLPQDSSISRRHATIRALEGAFLVMDEGSANGIFVNGVRVTQATPLPLNPGDEVEIGSTKFQFVI